MQNYNTIEKRENKVLFQLGQILMTFGATEALEESGESLYKFLTLHQSGEWGIVGKEDWNENDLSVGEGLRILSAYKTKNGEKIWIITEADRSATTILLPEEY